MSVLFERVFQAPQTSFFLFGPRGTGKSTWLREHFPKALYIDLLDPAIFRTYAAEPERLMARIRASTDSPLAVVVDEIQRLPELLPVVHSMIEEDKTRLFVLTGSSARKLKRAGTDLLAGRAVLTNLFPLIASEMGDSFDLEEALRIGMLPVVVSSTERDSTLAAYAALYVKEEVQAEGLVRNIGGFHRFLEALAFSQAAVVNASSLARECQVERKTVCSFLDIVEDLLLGWRLDVFRKRAQRAVTSQPKFYFADVGMFRGLRRTGPLDRPSEIEGAALEGLVAQHLRAWCGYRGQAEQLFFWRTRTGLEVDFVVYGAETFCAIEVKNSGRIRPEDLRGVRAFIDEYPEARAFLLYRGEERLKLGEILCLPVKSYLRELHPDRLLPV